MKRGPEQPTHARATQGLTIIGIYLVVVGSVLLVLFSTLYPFHFEQFYRISHLHRYFDGFIFGGYHRCCTYLAILEPLGNMLLFLPLGFGLTGLISRKTSTRTIACVIILLLCLGFSFMIETLQVFQPRRTPSLTDVLMNTIGGGLGFVCFQVWGEALTRYASALMRR